MYYYQPDNFPRIEIIFKKNSEDRREIPEFPEHSHRPEYKFISKTLVSGYGDTSDSVLSLENYLTDLHLTN